jgi:hypothetical protein
MRKRSGRDIRIRFHVPNDYLTYLLRKLDALSVNDAKDKKTKDAIRMNRHAGTQTMSGVDSGIIILNLFIFV